MSGKRHDNGTSDALLTQPHLPHSPYQKSPFGWDPPPTHARTNRSATDLQAAKFDLLESCLSATNAVLFGIYQDWFHQIKVLTWMTLLRRMVSEKRWVKLVSIMTQRYDILSVKVEKNNFSRLSHWSSTEYKVRSGTRNM